jgi:hypothetical protein
MLLSGALWPVIGVGLGLIVRSLVAAIVGGILWPIAIEEMLRGAASTIWGGYLRRQAGLARVAGSY